MVVVIALLLAASPATPLNTEGFRLYRLGRWSEAITSFRAGIAADQSHALSHYNLAATLGRVRSLGKTCEFEAYQGTVLEELETSIRLDEKRRARAKLDADFASVRGSFRYQALFGRSPANDSDVRALVTTIRWLTPAQGAFGNTHELRFSTGGTVVLTRLVMNGDMPKRETLKGRWTLKGREVRVDIGPSIHVTGVLNADGHLVLDGLGDFSDQPAECDA